MSDHLSTLKLHRYRYGELTGEESTAARAHLETCATCSERLRAQENHRAAFELEPLPAAVRTPPPRRGFDWRWLAAPMIAAAIALAALGGPRLTTPEAPGTRSKGVESTVELWVDAPEGPRAVAPGAELHPGDRVQLRVRKPPTPWITLAGSDEGGTVEIYFSWQAVEGEDWQPAPYALGIDDTLGTQRFHAVFTEERPSLAEVRRLVSNEREGGRVETLSFRTVP